MSIDVTTVSVPINVSASGTKVEATVSGGIGPAGTAATITIGTVTTGAAGSSAAVVNAGSTSAAVLNFTIPAGATGPQGPAGPPGTTTWAGITDKPATFAPAAHTHAPAEVGLGNVDNTADASKPVSTAQAAADAAVASAAAADATSKANAAQANAIQRANHTGTQAISTVSGLQAALDAKATPADVTAAVAAVVDAAPAALDTLNELAAALGDDANFASTVTTALAGKAAAVHGHVIADVTGLQDALNGKQVAGSYAEAVHFHSIQDVMNLESELNGKQAAGSYAAAVHGHSIGDVTGLQTALDGKAGTSHTHVIANVTGLQAALDGKQAAGSYAAATHGHTISEVTGLQAALDGKQAAGSYAATVHTHGISDVTGLQTALDGKAATTHGHAIADVTGLQTALDGKQATGSYAAASHGHVIGDVTGLQTALDGKQVAGSYAAASHAHAAGDITSGTMAAARLGSGTAGPYTWLAGDSAWKTFAFIPGFSGFADADDWATRVTTNGGSVSASTMTAVYQFCLAIAAAGIRERFYRLNLFAGTGLTSALVPLYRGPTRTGTQYGNTTDTNTNFVSGDYVETGSTGGLQGLRTATKRLETGVNGSTFSGFNFHASAYEIAGSDTTYDNSVGAWAAASSAGFSMGTSDAVTKYECSVVNNGMQLSQTAIAGHYIASQTGNRVGLLIGSGGQISTAYAGGANLISDWSSVTWGISIYALQQSAGSFANYSSSRLGGYSFGLSLTAAQASAFYAAMEQFQAAMGRKP